MSSSHLFQVTDANFDAQVSAAGGATLVDFGASWCPPCRRMEPLVAALAGELAGRVRVASCNVDENPAVAARLGVRSLPTLMLFQDGRVVGQLIGAVPRPRIDELLARLRG